MNSLHLDTIVDILLITVIIVSSYFAICKVRKLKYNIIGLSGKIGVGKDTAAAIIKEKHPGYELCSFAEPLKRIVSILTNTSYESQFTREGKACIPSGYKNSVGWYHQSLGQFFRKYFCDDIWVNLTLCTSGYKIITDVRYPNEVRAIEDAGGIVIRIERNVKYSDFMPAANNQLQSAQDFNSGRSNAGYTSSSPHIQCLQYTASLQDEFCNLADGRSANHISETSLDNYNFTYTVSNDGTLEEFKQKILNICD